MSDEEKKVKSAEEAEETKETEEVKEEKSSDDPVERDAGLSSKASAEEEVPTESVGKKKSEPSGSPSKASATDGKHADLIKQIETMSVLELSELVKVLEDRFGVSAAAPMMMAGGAAPAAGAEAAEEKTNFSVVLASAGDQKIAVIKAVRELRPDLGLVDAKTLVESAPKEVLKDAKKVDAEAAKVKLEAAGAKVELK